MRVRGIVAVIVGLLAAAPIAAGAGSADTSSSTAFIAAATRFEAQAIALYGRERAALNALTEHVRLSCPGAVPGWVRSGTAAQQRVWTALLIETGDELALAELRPLRGAARRAYAQVSHLRWSDPALDRAVGTFVREIRAATLLNPPDLCLEAKAASTSNFSLVPTATAAFLRRAAVAMPDSAPTFYDLATRMRRYFAPGGAAAMKHLRALDAQLNRLTARLGVRSYIRLTQTYFG